MDIKGERNPRTGNIWQEIGWSNAQARAAGADGARFFNEGSEVPGGWSRATCGSGRTVPGAAILAVVSSIGDARVQHKSVKLQERRGYSKWRWQSQLRIAPLTSPWFRGRLFPVSGEIYGPSARELAREVRYSCQDGAPGLQCHWFAITISIVELFDLMEKRARKRCRSRRRVPSGRVNRAQTGNRGSTSVEISIYESTDIQRGGFCSNEET